MWSSGSSAAIRAEAWARVWRVGEMSRSREIICQLMSMVVYFEEVSYRVMSRRNLVLEASWFNWR